MGTTTIDSLQAGGNFRVLDGPSALEVMFNLFHPETRRSQYVALVIQYGTGKRHLVVEINGFDLDMPKERTTHSLALGPCRIRGQLIGLSLEGRKFTCKYDLKTRKGQIRIAAATTQSAPT
jgi:hypothetical protein